MSDAITEIRCLLDERGVKRLDDGYTITEWKNADGRICRAYARPEPLTVDVAIIAATPQQAIDATLGREPDDAEVEKLHDRLNAALLNYARSQEHTKERVTAVIEAHTVLELAVALGCGAKVVGE